MFESYNNIINKVEVESKPPKSHKNTMKYFKTTNTKKKSKSQY